MVTGGNSTPSSKWVFTQNATNTAAPGVNDKCPWSTMECSQPAKCTTNRSLHVASRTKAFPRRPTNSGSTLPTTAHLEGSVIGCHRCPHLEGSVIGCYRCLHLEGGVIGCHRCLHLEGGVIGCHLCLHLEGDVIGVFTWKAV